MSGRAVLLTFLSIAVICAALVVLPSYGPNHATADRVVRDAGVPATVQPGPGGTS
jgi:hypothetical protein